MNKQAMVREFHEAFECVINETPTIPDMETRWLRRDLIEEELAELAYAFNERDINQVADAIADLLYVVYGTAVSCGIDIDPVFAEVHRSNMSKVGGHKAENGKWIKPATYSPADIAGVLAKQEAK